MTTARPSATAPQVGAAAPQVRAAAPQVGAAAPQAGATAPQAEATAPQAEATAPQAEASTAVAPSSPQFAASASARASLPPAPFFGEVDGVRCMQMRGGSSKSAYFLAEDLPSDPAERDDVLLRIMGSPDERQIDGLGGGHPLTSKVAVVSPSTDPSADVDYLFLQVVPDRPVVTDAQTCGNLLAGVGPFAIERGLVRPTGDTTDVRIRMLNPTNAFARATVRTPGGRVTYAGDAVMAGTPFPAAPISLTFPGGDSPLFPTGRLVDRFAGLDVTCVHGGMPVVLVRAADLGLAGDELPSTLEDDTSLRKRIEELRLEAGPAMGLGNVAKTTIPKISIVSPPRSNGTVTTRTFIPHRVHAAIGVLGAVSVAAAIRTPGTNVFVPHNEHVRNDRSRDEQTRDEHGLHEQGRHEHVRNDQPRDQQTFGLVLRPVDERVRSEHIRDGHPRNEQRRDEHIPHEQGRNEDGLRELGRDEQVRNERGRDERGRDERGRDERVRIEHPSGTFDVTVALDVSGAATRLRESSVVRTARKLSDGLVWPRTSGEVA